MSKQSDFDRASIYVPSTNPYRPTESMPIDLKRCRAMVHSGVYGQCSKKAVVTRHDHGFCKQHDPEAVKVRDAKRMKRYEEESERRAYGSVWREREELAKLIEPKIRGSNDIAASTLRWVLKLMERRTDKEKKS